MSAGTVAVIGLGALGLVTLKNLLEKGFEVTGFDKSDAVGGLWNFTEHQQTSVLESTVANISKQRMCFTDFPFARDIASYPSARQVQRYLCDYSQHFGLMPHVRLGNEVIGATFDKVTEKWTIESRSRSGQAREEVFDRLVLATGINSLPHIPDIEGLDRFEGQVLHSMGYKRPESFKDKVVMIVGMSNSTADVATTLTEHAKHVYVSRRHDVFIFSRLIDGKPIDHSFTNRKGTIANALNSFAPALAQRMSRNMLGTMTRKAFPHMPKEWDLATAPLTIHGPPVVSDTMIPQILAGNISLVKGIAQVVDGRKVRLQDGEEISVDAIVLCTGYQTGFALAGPYDPTLEQPAAWTDAAGSNSRKLPGLYRNIFSLHIPHHLAFMGSVTFLSPAFQLYDLASMALARIWSGEFALPTKGEMAAQVDRQQKWLVSLAAESTIMPGWVDGAEWMAWADEAAGSDALRHMGYGLAGWMLWFRDPKLSKALLDGVPSPHQFRLFDTGKRPAWSGARQEILRVNGMSVE